MADYIQRDVLSGVGKNVDYIRELDELCPACGAQTQSKLHVRSILDNTATIECPHCGYIEPRHKDTVMEATDLHGRPLKVPQK